MPARSGSLPRLSRVFACLTLVAVSAASGWIGGVMVTRAQVLAVVDQLSRQARAATGAPTEVSRPEDYFKPSTCFARYR